MIEWIKTSDRQPPLKKRVLVWIEDSRLLDWDQTFIRVYLMARIPERVEGNHIVPYSYRCENSGMEYGHNVTHWAEIEGPNA